MWQHPNFQKWRTRQHNENNFQSTKNFYFLHEIVKCASTKFKSISNREVPCKKPFGNCSNWSLDGCEKSFSDHHLFYAVEFGDIWCGTLRIAPFLCMEMYAGV